MRKSNFVLTRNNWKFFVFRFNKLLSKNECVVINSIYTGQKGIATMLKKAGFTKSSFIIPTEKTNDCYITKGSVTHPFSLSTDASGIVMNRIGGVFIYIPFGTKMYLTSNKIVYKDNGRIIRNSGSITTIQSYFYKLKAQRRIDDDKVYEDQYWKDYEKEFDESFKRELDMTNKMLNY